MDSITQSLLGETASTASQPSVNVTTTVGKTVLILVYNESGTNGHATTQVPQK